MKFNLLLALVSISILSYSQGEDGSNKKSTVFDQSSFAQKCYNYTWDETFDKSKYDSIMPEDREATIVLDKTILVHRPTGIPPRSPFRKKFTHQIYWIHQESAIEKMNEVYLYESSSSKVLKVHVRTIDQDGSVVEFDESKLEDVSKNEGGSNYKILAIPGIEIGSWVEVLIEYDGFPNQSRMIAREPFDIIQSEVIYIPAYESQERDGKIDPKIIPHNGYKLTSYDGLNIRSGVYAYRANDITAQITDESYVHNYLECPRVDITTDTYEWKNMSHGIHRNYLALETILNRSGKVHKLLKEIGADQGSELSKIEAIERYIKEQITKTEEDGIQFEQSQRVIKNKVANIKGIIMLYKTLFENCGIEYEPYLIYDKDYVTPAKDMPMSLGLSDFVFYFPRTDVYVMPESNYYRVGRLANYLCGMPALFLQDNFGTNRDDYLIIMPEAKKEYNVDRSINRIVYNEDDESLTINTAKHYFGDRAILERGSLNFMDDKEKDENIKDILISKLEDATLSDVQMFNWEIGLNANSKDSMIYTGQIVTEDMISPIGNGFLLNLPKIIGNQVSFYEEGKRVHNVYSPVAKVYDHTIEFVIPEGYEVQGIENLEFDRNYYTAIDGESKWISSFVSKAEINDGILTVTVHEFYEEGLFPKSEIEDYRAVVNAAYEFYIAQIKVVQK